MLALVLASQLVLAGAPAQLTIDIQPAGVEVKLDGKKVGTSGDKPLVVGKLKAGVHVLRVEHKGDAHEEEIALKAGEKKTFVLKLEDGHKEPSEPSTP
jgi:hypothetical protein